jgi:hypothetical protein
MNLSPYFHDLTESYQAEIDDLTSDSEGRDVLQRRLRDKRSKFDALLPMMDTYPEMLVPALHGAFEFPAGRSQVLDEVLAAGEFGDTPSWALVAGEVRIASWAHPLIDAALREPLGEAFLALAVGMEYALTRHKGAGAAVADDDTKAGSEGDDGDEGDEADALGEDFLEQQGFDRRTPQ